MHKLKLAIVGCGYWGPNLARVFSENDRSEVGWLVDRDTERLARLAKRHPHARLTTDIGEMLADPQTSAVALATPVSTHFPLAKACLEAGKSVLVEKPMAQSVAECTELIGLAARKKLTLMVDHTFIYTAAVRKMKALIHSGELGDIYYFDSVRVNLGLFQHDVNVIWDLAPHDLTIMDYCLGKRPLSVAAHGACHVKGSAIENIAYITLRFPDDIIAHFHVNWLAPAKIRRVIIGGSRKMLVYDDLSPDEKLKLYDKGLELGACSLIESHQVLAGYRIGDVHVPNLDATEALKREADHFLDCLITGQEPESNGEAGRRVVEILEAAQESLRSNGTFVQLGRLEAGV